MDADGDEPLLGVGESVESVSSGPDIVAVTGLVSFDLYHVTANGHGAPSDEADADQTHTNTNFIDIDILCSANANANQRAKSPRD